MNKIVDLERLGVFKGKLDEIIISGSVSGSVYDVVIRTQEQFDTLLASEDWLGASSVCFVGDGGDLEFTSNSTILIPMTVKQLVGINDCIIHVSGDLTNAIMYESLPEGCGYSMSDITVKFTTSSANLYYCLQYMNGVRNCNIKMTASSGDGGAVGIYSSTNCTVNEITVSSGSGSAYGIAFCTNCTVNEITVSSSSSSSSSYGIYSCTNCTVNEITVSSGSGSAYGIAFCTNCTVNEITVSSSSSSSSSYGIYSCTNCTVNEITVSSTYSVFGVIYSTNCTVNETNASSISHVAGIYSCTNCTFNKINVSSSSADGSTIGVRFSTNCMVKELNMSSSKSSRGIYSSSVCMGCTITITDAHTGSEIAAIYNSSFVSNVKVINNSAIEIASIFGGTNTHIDTETVALVEGV